MVLRCLWGKLGQQSNKCQVESMTFAGKFYDLVRKDSRNIYAVRVVNEQMLEIVHNYRDECDPI